MSLDSHLQPPLCRSNEIKIHCIEPNSSSSPIFTLLPTRPPHPHMWKTESSSFAVAPTWNCEQSPYHPGHPTPNPSSATELTSSSLIHFLDRWSKYLANIIYDFVINKPFTEVIQGVLGNFKDNFQQVSKVGSAWDTEPIVFAAPFICFELLVLPSFSWLSMGWLCFSSLAVFYFNSGQGTLIIVICARLTVGREKRRDLNEIQVLADVLGKMGYTWPVATARVPPQPCSQISGVPLHAEGSRHHAEPGSPEVGS